MIDREFIEKIEDMTGPKVIVTPQGAFADKHLYRVENKLADTIVLSSLSGLAEMIKQEINEYNLPLFVRATSAERVHVFGIGCQIHPVQQQRCFGKEPQNPAVQNTALFRFAIRLHREVHMPNIAAVFIIPQPLPERNDILFQHPSGFFQ